MEHTLGPLRILPVERTKEHETKIVPEVGADGQFPFVCILIGEEREPAAHLIVAAPELLEAAEEILDVSGYRLTQDRRPGTMLEKLLQAVEKATGGE